LQYSVKNLWLIAITTSALAAGPGGEGAAIAAPPPTLGPTTAISEPVPAGEVAFGKAFPNAVVRPPSGTLVLIGSVDAGLLRPTSLTIAWPYRHLWVPLVSTGGTAGSAIVGRDGARLVAAPVTPEAIGPVRTLITLPRRYSRVRFADLDADHADDVVALDPRTGDLRVAQLDTGAGPLAASAGRWPRGYTLQLADLDGDEIADAAGVDAAGHVYVGINDVRRFVRRPGAWRIPPDASMVLAEMTGDDRADLVFRRAGQDDVYVRAAIITHGKLGFRPFRRLGRWDHRLALTARYRSLIARDAHTGRIVMARLRGAA
jgi:hypothetical protein